jgi:biopolymer transport protein ExbB/TolQ
LGILGTVAGLIEKLGNIAEMESALSISMGTTFVGLLAAIFLKIIDAVWVNRSINKMTLFFDTFEQNYQMAKDKHIEAVGKQSAGE